MANYASILVAHDFSPHSAAALEAAVDLASRLGSDLHLVHVVQSPTYAYGYGFPGGSTGVLPIDLGAVCDAAREALEGLARDVKLEGKIKCHVDESINVPDRILMFAEHLGADLIVMGTHGRTGLAHVFLGSVAERTLRSAPCPVLTVHADKDEE